MENGLAEGAALVPDDDPARSVQWFEEAEEASQEARRLAERDRDYVDNKQWTAEEIATLKRRRQPVVTVNRIARKIQYLKGLEIQERTDPKAYPRTPQHEAAAEAATDALRYVVQNERYDRARSRAWDNMLVEGYGGIEVSAQRRGDRYEIKLIHVSWDRLFHDPHSAETDFSDARYFGSVAWMDHDAAVDRWPNAQAILEATINGEASSGSNSDTYEDKPRFRVWADATRKRVRVVKMHYKKAGQWRTALFVKAGYLEEPRPSPFLDEHGEPEPELILQSAHVDRDNNRYGVVREMIPLQDEPNKRRSKATHLLNSRQAIAESGAVDDIRKAQAELAKPDGAVEVNHAGDRPLRFELLNTGDLTAGQTALMREASAELDLMGPNAARQGKDPRQMSGRAILARRQGGSIELNPMRDNRRDLDLRVYRAVWNRIRQFQTAEWWIRVTDEEENLKFVGLNQPVTMGRQLLEQLERQGVPREAMRAEIQSVLSRNGLSEQALNQPVAIRNAVAEMDVDIILEDAPDTTNIQIEEFEILAKLARTGAVPPDVLIEASSMRANKRKRLLERLRGQRDPEQAAARAQEREAVKALAMRREEAEIEEIVSSALQKRAAAEKSLADAEKAEAETPPGGIVLGTEPESPAPSGAFHADDGQRSNA